MGDMSTLAARLAWARQAANASARELSGLATVAHSLVSLIEQGAKSPRGDTLRKLSEALGVSIDWLFLGVGQRPSERRIRLHTAAALAEFRRTHRKQSGKSRRHAA